jgi:restriction system protein
MSLPFRNNATDVTKLLVNWEAQRQAQHVARQVVQQAVSDTLRVAVHDTITTGDDSAVDYGELLLQAQIVIFGDKTNEGHLIQAVAIPWIEIIREWEREPDFIFRLSSRQLEELVAGAYEQAGCREVILTPQSADKGRDVIVTATYPGIGTVRFVDQVKRYARHHKVNADEVRALLGVLYRDREISKGIVTTTSEFAPEIYKELADYIPTRLELKNGAQLKEWLIEFDNKS